MLAVKSSKRGSTILSVVNAESTQLSTQEETGYNIETGSTKVNETTSVEVTLKTGKSQNSGTVYGWKPDYALAQISHRPEESWLIYQAQSVTGNLDITLEEAKELFTKIDVTSRDPVLQATQRPAGVVAALRAWLGVGMICLIASGCSKSPEVDRPGPAQLDQRLENIASLPYGINEVYKFYDRTEGVVCYVTKGNNSVSMNCMVAKPGDGQ